MNNLYTPLNVSETVQKNPHSPAPASVKQQPVGIPGVIQQSQQLYTPYTPKESK